MSKTEQRREYHCRCGNELITVPMTMPAGKDKRRLRSVRGGL